MNEWRRISHERSYQTFDFSMDSHYLWHSDHRLHLRFADGYSKLRLVYSVCLVARIADFRIVDVERPRCSTAHFEKSGG